MKNRLSRIEIQELVVHYVERPNQPVSCSDALTMAVSVVDVLENAQGKISQEDFAVLVGVAAFLSKQAAAGQSGGRS